MTVVPQNIDMSPAIPSNCSDAAQSRQAKSHSHVPDPLKTTMDQNWSTPSTPDPHNVPKGTQLDQLTVLQPYKHHT